MSSGQHPARSNQSPPTSVVVTTAMFHLQGDLRTRSFRFSNSKHQNRDSAWNRCSHLPRPAMGTSILAIHNSPSVGRDSRCTTAKNYKYNALYKCILKNISDIWLFQELCYFPLFLIRPNYSPYAACSSRRARVCSMLSSWGAVQVSSLISPHCVYQPKCRLRRTRGAALSVWLLIVAEKNRPAAQMHRLACAELRADGEKWLVYQMWAKNNSANDLSNLFKFVQQILNRLEWHWSIK